MSSSVGRNSLIMASGTAASRVTGQIRTILLAWALGTTGYAANAYQAGSMIPQVIYTWFPAVFSTPCSCRRSYAR